MPPKPKTMSTRNKGTNNASKMPHRKAAKRARFSAAIQQDLDNEEEVTDKGAVTDLGLDMASSTCMDMMMTMLVYPTK